MAATLRTALLLAVAALTWGAGCATCPPREVVKETVTPTRQCVQLAPPVAEAAPKAAPPAEAVKPTPPPEEGRGAPRVAPAPAPPAEKPPEAAPPERERVLIGPGPEVRAAVPLGPVPPGVYRVRRGDTLWGISARAYGDPFKWRDIFQANRATVSDPNLIYPFQELQIPKAG
jgi:nucleoid-associated protein YgaU